jgi:uracil-DNA glycosylase family 4
MTMSIDWEALDVVEQGAIGKRIALGTTLSERYVGGEGDNPEAFIIGEAPGADEDVKGRPFIGRAGIVLRQLMELANLYSEHRSLETGAPNCWLTNVVKFRPLPRNRTPVWEEIQAFRPLLKQEWVAVGKPRLIIPVGGVALSAVLGHQRTSILRAAGKCHWYRAHYGHADTLRFTELAVWPMVHPSFALRQKQDRLKELLEQDWERLGEWRHRQK